MKNWIYRCTWSGKIDVAFIGLNKQINTADLKARIDGLLKLS